MGERPCPRIIVHAKAVSNRKNFVGKLIPGIPVKRNSYGEFMRWLKAHKSQNQTIAQWLNVTRAGEQILCSIHPPVTFPQLGAA